MHDGYGYYLKSFVDRKDKQVVITTHDHDLLELLNGCQELNLVMKNGISTLEKK